jgi:flagellar hook-length control protein FliK
VTSIDPGHLIGPLLLDMLPAEAGVETVPPGRRQSFDDYLQRAQGLSAIVDESKAGPAEKDSAQSQSIKGQPPVAPAASRADDKSGEAANGAERAADFNSVAVDDLPQQDKGIALAQEANTFKSNEKAADEAIGRLRKPGAPETNRQRADESDADVNPDAALAGNPSVEADKASAVHRAENKNSKTSPVASKEKTLKVARDALATTASAAGGASNDVAAEEAGAPVSPVAKGKAKKAESNTSKRSGAVLALRRAVENGSRLEQGEASGVKTSRGISAASSDMQRKIAGQKEKKEQTAARATGPAGAQEDLPAAQTGINAARTGVLPAAISATAELTIPSGRRIDSRGAGLSSKSVAEAALGDAQPIASAPKTIVGKANESGEQPGSQIDRARFVQRVERAFAAIGDRGGSVRLRLSPPELGSLRLEITVSKGRVSARLETETKEAKNLLLDNLPALSERLAQQNIKVQKFEVDLRDPATGGMPQQTAQQAESGSRRGDYQAGHAPARGKSAPAPLAAETVGLKGHDGQLNVIV